MPKGKFVSSMISFFGKKSKNNDENSLGVKRQNPARSGRKSMLDADSFVFLPGEKVDLYWGAVLNNQNYPVSDLAADYSTARAIFTRRQTVSSKFLTRSDESGSQNVQVLRPRANTNALQENTVLKSGSVFSRRLSGTLIRSKKSMEALDDEALVTDEELYVTDRERWSQDLSGRYVYDRIYSPKHEPCTSTPSKPVKATQVEAPSRHSFMHSPPAIPGYRPGRRRPSATESEQPLSTIQSRVSHSYYDVEADRLQSEYDLPWDSVDWERIKRRAFQDSGEYSTIGEANATLLGKPIHAQEVILEDKIGEGQFGDVHKGVLHPNTHEETLVAIKTCKPDATAEERTKFLEEAAVMRKFSHPHIIKLFGVMTDNSATYIIMELASYGQLRRYLLTEGSRISSLTLLHYIHQLSMAMVHLETLNFVHRDIAARNVLVATPDCIKLADFGLSRGLDDADYYVASHGKLPIKWMAPESINFRRFTGLSDVWMFGVCSWEVLMRGVKPFVGIKNDEVIAKIEMGERLQLPPECPASLFRLMNLCWQYDPLERPSFKDISAEIRYIIDEEKQMSAASGVGRRNFLIERDPNAPLKPTRKAPPSMQRVPSDSLTNRMSTHSEMMDDRNGPPLPPRVFTRGMEPSVSPPSLPSDHHDIHHRPPAIEPYSVTTIGTRDNGFHEPHIPSQRRSESPLPSSIPPPSIIRQAPRESSSSGSGIYYSTVAADMNERSSGRALNEDGTFVDTQRTSVSSGDSGPGLRPRMGETRPLSHVSNASSGRSSPPVFKPSPPSEEAAYVPPDDDPIVLQTTSVVKSIMELSNKVPLSRPNQYVDLVKNVGMTLRDLLGKVDEEMKNLPAQSHQEVSMAHKVLSSDMTTLVEAMKNAQKNYQTFLEADYQKQFLKAAHIVAVNSKLLLDAVNSARRKQKLMQ